jgi:hypothetical protein
VVVYQDFSVEKVGAGIGVERSWINDANRLAIDGGHIREAPKSVLPYILHQFLHKKCS